MSSSWSIANIPSQNGKIAIVTGANSGIGFFTALEIGRAGASVVVACRDEHRAEEAIQKMKQQAPNASFLFGRLDLADLNSIRDFTQQFLSQEKPLDILVNNAGVMAPPLRQTTKDGFELQFGTNHLGHFALTGNLLPALMKSNAPRVVTVSSGVAFWGKLNLSDLQSEQNYKPMPAYSQSKLANLAFMLELGLRAPWLISVASHPGAATTNLQKYAFTQMIKLIGQPASQGALPSLRAAVEQTKSGVFYAPKHLFHMRGAPVEINLPKQDLDRALISNLWRLCEEMTSVRYDFSRMVAVN